MITSRPVGFTCTSAVALSLVAMLGTAGCTTSVDGTKDGPKPRSFDIAVGATATIVLGDPRCGSTSPSAYGCLTGRRPEGLERAEVIGDGALTVVGTRVETRGLGRILVDVKATRAGGGTLRVEYRDLLDGSTHDDFVLRSLPITHVVEGVACQFDRGMPDSHRYPISRGSRASVLLTPMHEDAPLLSGQLELIANRGGLDPNVFVDESEGTVARLLEPLADGVFKWTLVGARPSEVTFDIYDPESVGALLTASPDSISVRPGVNGVPTCFYSGTGRAMTHVSAGACKLIAGDYELEGEFPVSLRRGGETFHVDGAGHCAVESRIGSGPVANLELDVGGPVVDRTPPGDAIGTEPLERGGTLAPRGTCLRVTKISNGKCEAINAAGFIVPDGDCLVGFDWFADPYEGDATNTNPVGVGLVTELRIGLKLKLFDWLTLKPVVPNALQYEPTPLEISRLGCDAISNYEALGIRPVTAGRHSVHFTADNAPEPLDYAVEARPVGKIDYLAEAVDARSSGDSKTSYHFPGSNLPLELAYADANGAPLRGRAPLRVSTTNASAGASIRGDASIFTGTEPNRITLASAVGASTHVLDVVDTSAVTTIGGITPKPFGLDTTCIAPFALAASGQRIHGTSPTRPRLSFSGGDACGVLGGLLASSSAATGRGDVCAAPVAGRASTTITVAWGNATATWTCQAQP